jgi:hypothetical protein
VSLPRMRDIKALRFSGDMMSPLCIPGTGAFRAAHDRWPALFCGCFLDSHLTTRLLFTLVCCRSANRAILIGTTMPTHGITKKRTEACQAPRGVQLEATRQ